MSNSRFLSVMDRMLMMDLLRTIFSVLSVLVIIIVSRNFIKILNMAVDGFISNEAVFKILALKIVLASVNFIVPAVFLSVLMVLGRMYRDQEMSALASAGVGIGRLYMTIAKVIIPLALMAAWMSFYVAPWAKNSVEQVIYQEKLGAGIRAISEGRFSEYGQGKSIFYVEKITEDQVMHDVFVQNTRDKQLGIITAERALIRDVDGRLFFVFMDGERVQGEAGAVDFVFEEFSEYAMLIDDGAATLQEGVEGSTTSRLFSTLAAEQVRELLSRLSVPMSVLMLTMLAVPLAQTQPRGGAYGNVIMAFLIYFSFANLEKICESHMLKGDLPFAVLFIFPYFLVAVIILILLVRFYSFSWISLYFRGKVL